MYDVKVYKNLYVAVWWRKILYLRIQACLRIYLVADTILPS